MAPASATRSPTEATVAATDSAWIAVLVAALAGSALALLFGWFCVRLAGVYLAMLTLAFAQVAWSIVFQWGDVTGGDDGTVKLEFTMPEALTEWRFLGFAHDNALRSAYLTDAAVTAKDLMVQPNPPRFLREGDVLEFTVKVSNQSAARQTGTVRLTLADARTTASVDDALGFLGPLSFCHQPIGGFAADRLVADILSILCNPGLRFTRKLAPLSLGYVNGLPFGACKAGRSTAPSRTAPLWRLY